MDITEYVMALASRHQVYATGVIDAPAPIINIVTMTFPDAGQARTAAAACMADGVPAIYAGPVQERGALEYGVVVLYGPELST